MTDDEQDDLLLLKASVEQHLSILHEELIKLSASTKDDPYFDALLSKAKYYRDILKRIEKQLNEEDA